MDRRHFIRRSFHSSVLLALTSLDLTACVSAPTVAGTSNYAPTAKGRLLVGIEDINDSSLIRFINWDTYEFEEFKIPLSRPHSIARNPLNPDEYYIWEINGSLLKINSKTSEQIKIDYTKQKSMHLGHGILTADGKRIFSTESSPNYREHKLVCRAADSLEVLEEKTGYKVLHHIVKLPESSTLAFADMRIIKGEPVSFLNFYDFESKLSHDVSLGEDHPIHLSIKSKSEILTITVPEKLEITHRRFDNNDVTQYLNSLDAFNHYLLETMSRQHSNLYKISADGKAERLSDSLYQGQLAGGFGINYLPKSQRYLSSYMISNNVVLWKDQAPLKTIEVNQPTVMVVSKDESELAVLSLDGDVSFYSLIDFKLIRKLGKDIKAVFMSAYA